MRMTGAAPVVVGVNGTASGLAAVRVAARESVRRHQPLRVVHAFAWPAYDASAQGLAYDVLRRRATEILDRAVATAVRSVPGARVGGYLVDGLPSRVLLQQSRTASLLVLGDDDLASTARLPTDSVLVQCVTRARCPALVARGYGPAAGPVLVGVDGSPTATVALRWAAAEAARRHTGLQIVHVSDEHCPEPADRAKALLEEAAAEVSGPVAVETVPAVGDPATVLAQAAAHAQLLVVGPRGAGVRAGTLFGSVAQAVLHRCTRPTVFVHGTGVGRHPDTGTVPSAPSGEQ